MTGLDILVVGSGVAGLSAAVRAAAGTPGMAVGVLSKASLSDSATQWAQGGVAAVLSSSEADLRGAADSVELHLRDTIAAGCGLCDPAAVEVLVSEGPGRVRELAKRGAVFDRSTAGLWELSREGGHSAPRVLHAGGAATGAEVERALVEAARQSAAALWEGWFALELLVEGGRCRGVVALSPDGEVLEVRARHTLLATGGGGQLYSVTTNPPQSTGDGVAMALEAGVAVADVEFVQFHPTALWGAAAGPRPLLSEALRGEGALLLDHEGRRFVDELSPRDVVASAMAERMAEEGVEHLWLDVRGVEGFEVRFPTIAEAVRLAGLDPASEWLPVAPAAHYLCGGVLTDLDGATTLPGLWAAGEVACSGVHGANRLASNSLLEGMVFAARAVEAIVSGKEGPSASGALLPLLEPGARAGGSPGAALLRSTSCPPRVDPGLPAGRGAVVWDLPKERERLQQAMTAGAGVIRDASSLKGVRSALLGAVETAREASRASLGAAETAREGSGQSQSRPAGAAAQAVSRAVSEVVQAQELANLAALAQAIVAAAEAREESRGGHRRRDYPDSRPDFAKRFVHVEPTNPRVGAS